MSPDMNAPRNSTRGNPFEVTKAVDFTDTQINSTWVDWPAPGGFADFISVRSPLARFVLGGKGTGRTHIMRHFSAPVQAIRQPSDPIAQVKDDGVLGIYVLCSGLNSLRFQGRGQDSKTWQTVFAQYMDVWLAQAALSAFQIIIGHESLDDAQEQSMVRDIMSLFYVAPNDRVPTTLSTLSEHLVSLTKNIDSAVNNAVLNRHQPLDLTLSSTPGSLVFGIPEAIRRHFSPLEDVTFLYLIDEFENFDEDQQKYVNTLVREKRAGTSFIVGVRTYGLRTHQVLGVGEENKRGSEVEEIFLDRKYTGRYWGQYREFCREIIDRRIEEERVEADERGRLARIEDLVEELAPDHAEEMVRERYEPTRRPYLRTLARQLSSEPVTADGAPLAPSDVQFVLDAVSVPPRPLLEKVNVLLIYRAWASGRSVLEAAHTIADTAPRARRGDVPEPTDAQRRVLSHYVTDLRAQLYDDMRLPTHYAGIDDFITMSDGLTRNLLIILKNTYRWALFNGEDPLFGRRISLDSQQKGVREAAAWFFADARPPGEAGMHVHDAIQRLGDMFRLFRFSNKPVESSLATFSADLTACSARARDVVHLAQQWALLVRAVHGQKDRNTRLMEGKFHLNRLLSPKWDLPTARRGSVRLSPAEMNAIFDPEHSAAFPRMMTRRLARMNAPFGRGAGPHARQALLAVDD
ncbi:MAG: hypothetical protein F4151_05735 [Gammaproteobacteria bacterium]|nr:hypothetical protein [Gammaproteobacteria bacterium]